MIMIYELLEISLYFLIEFLDYIMLPLLPFVLCIAIAEIIFINYERNLEND